MTNVRASNISSVVSILASWLVVAGFAGAALAQPSTAEPAPPSAAAPAPPPPAAAPAPSDARKACAEAMNADPKFAAEIVKVADEKAAKQRDDDTVKAHQDAVAHVEKNERHVIYAYASMWIIAAAFVIFLWRRQLALKGEIANLRRDLDAAAHEPAATKGRA